MEMSGQADAGAIDADRSAALSGPGPPPERREPFAAGQGEYVPTSLALASGAPEQRGMEGSNNYALCVGAERPKNDLGSHKGQINCDINIYR